MPEPLASRAAGRRPGSGRRLAAPQEAPASSWVTALAGPLHAPLPLAPLLLLAALDRVACPLLLLRPDATVLHANRLARQGLLASGTDAGADGLTLGADGRLRLAGQPETTAALHAALKALQRGDGAAPAVPTSATSAASAVSAAPGTPWAAAAGRVLWLAAARGPGQAAAPGGWADPPAAGATASPGKDPGRRAAGRVRIDARGGPSAGSAALSAAVAPAAPDAGRPAAQGPGFGQRGWALVALRAADGRAAGLLVGPADSGAGPAELGRFAADIGLTAAEARVLQALSRGEEPAAIAQRSGVSLATVRSQLAALRKKSGRGRLTTLMREVAALPPVAADPLLTGSPTEPPTQPTPEPTAESTAQPALQPRPGALAQAASPSQALAQRATRSPWSSDGAAHGPPGGDASAALLAPWLPAVVDALGIGLLFFDGRGRLALANAAARRRLRSGPDGEGAAADGAPAAAPATAVTAAPTGAGLAAGAVLGVVDAALHTRQAADANQLRAALVAAGAGRRGLLRLGSGDETLWLSLLPLPGSAVLGVLGRAPGQEWPGLAAYARHLRLTGAETQVLAALAAGAEPCDIARRQAVAMSTLRTQIGSLRAKSGAPSIRELVRQLAALPLVATAWPAPRAGSATAASGRGRGRWRNGAG
jgi:DNA-binding CsgD family transcriptional regulator